MSTIVMAACWPLFLPATEKVVLISLADQANDEGECWPSVGTICRRTCLGERTVQRSLRELEARGLLQVFKSARKVVYAGGATFVNRYVVRLGALRQMLAEQRAAAAAGPADEEAETGALDGGAPRHTGTPPHRRTHPATVAPKPS